MPDGEPPGPPDGGPRHETEALRRNEERFRALVEHSADVIVLIGADARFTYASASSFRVLGRPPEDVVGRDCFELMHPDDVERCGLIWRQCLENPGMTVRADFRYLHQDGSWRHMEADGVNRLSDPAVLGIVANFRDVTGRKRAEEARHRSEERQALLYAVLAAAGAELDAGHALAAAVRVMSERTGWRTIHLSVPAEDGRHWRVKACSDDLLIGRDLPVGPGIVGRAFLTGRTQLVPDVSLDPDYVGVVPGIRSELAVPIRHHGRTLGVLNLESERLNAFSVEDARLAESVADAVALALDNASLYRAAADERERLRSLIAATDDGILLVGATGAIHVINEPAVRLLGAGARGPWLGRPAANLARALAPESAAASGVLGWEAQRGASDEERREGEYVAPGLAVRWTSMPVRTAEAFLGRLLILRDVTEERRLRRLQEDLTDALVHDLRGPLTSITGAVGVLEGDASARAREWAERATRAAARMLAMVDSILEISRLEKGAMPVQRRSLPLPRVVAEAVDARRSMAAEKGLRLDVVAPAGLPDAWADPPLVARVLDNLVANALKFTPAGGHVRVGVEARDRDLSVTVSDTGPGIPPALESRLFEKFASGDRSGSGLGLAFCRLAVEAQGGRIWAESRPGQGAAFTFTLPLASAAS